MCGGCCCCGGDWMLLYCCCCCIILCIWDCWLAILPMSGSLMSPLWPGPGLPYLSGVLRSDLFLSDSQLEPRAELAEVSGDM